MYFLSITMQDELLIQEDLLDVLPMVEEANAISQELDRKVLYRQLTTSKMNTSLLSDEVICIDDDAFLNISCTILATVINCRT